MNDKELKEALNEITKDLKFLDMIINSDWNKKEKEEKFYINSRQFTAIKKLFNLFKSLNWQLALNEYTNIITKDDKAIDTRRCGIPVKIRPCAEEYNNKTYFGILIGEIPATLSYSIHNKKDLTISRSMYNPAIFVPELKKIIFGYESWWGEINSEEELQRVITDDTINNVWYVQMLQSIQKGEEEK